MPEKTQKKKLGKNPPSDHEMVETTSSIAEEKPCLSECDFEDFTKNLENRMIKRLRDTKHSHREIHCLIKNLSSKVDNLSNSSLERGCSNSRIDTQGGFSDVSISDADALNGTRKNTSLNINFNPIFFNLPFLS